MITVSGDLLEGGGQILRTTLALSSLLSKPVRVTNIRAKRSPPGLRAQHLASVKTLVALTDAKIQGLEVGSKEIAFEPGPIKSGDFSFDIGTAGSIGLVLQALMPAAAFSSGPIRLRLTGGTAVSHSPTIGYLQRVYLPILKKMGYDASIMLLRHGHYPKGGGLVEASIKPVKRLTRLEAEERGKVVRIAGSSHCVKLPRHVAERQAMSAVRTLRDAGYAETDIEIDVRPDGEGHLGPGSGIVLYAECDDGGVLGSDALGEPGKRAERVGEEAASRLLEDLETGCALDRYMGDMIIPYLAVAEGISTVTLSKVTLHLLTNVKVAEMLSGARFDIIGDLGEKGSVSVQGLSLLNSFIK